MGPFDRQPKKARDNLHDLILANRFSFLSGPVAEKNAKELIERITYFAQQNPCKDQALFINCPGGYVVPAMELYDTMQSVATPVHTVVLGLAASIGCYILSGGAVNGRMAGANATIMMYQPMSIFAPVWRSELDEDINPILHMYRFGVIVRDYVERTGRPESIIEVDLGRDTVMTAMEAKDYGIIDGILPNSKKPRN